jgi:uncharacterized protein (DUF1499 family)
MGREWGALRQNASWSKRGRAHNPVGTAGSSLRSALPGIGKQMKKLLKILVTVFSILAVVVLVRFAMLGHGSKSGRAPGLLSGTLVPCPDKPNCVGSEFGEAATHYIAPLDYAGAPPEQAWADILQVIEELGGEVVSANDEYIAATFSSSLFGFIDDVECRLEPSQKRIQIRSASRVGHSDLGVNRKRMDAMTRLFDRRMSGGVVE